MESEGVDFDLLDDSSNNNTDNCATNNIQLGGLLPDFRCARETNVNTSNSNGDGDTGSKLQLGYNSPDNNSTERDVNSDIPPVTASVEKPPTTMQACPSEREVRRLQATGNFLLELQSLTEAQLAEKQQELSSAYARIAKVERDNLLATAHYQELELRIKKLFKDFKNERNGYETNLFEINSGLSSILEKVKRIRSHEPGGYVVTSQFPVTNNASRMSQFPDIVEVDLEASLRDQFNVAKQTLSEIQTNLGNGQSHAALEEMCLELDPEDLLFGEENQNDGNGRYKSNPSRDGVQMNAPLTPDEPAPRIMTTFSANANSTSCPGSYGAPSYTYGDYAAVPQEWEREFLSSSSSRLTAVSDGSSPAKQRKLMSSGPESKDIFQRKLASQPIIVGSSPRSEHQPQELQQESLHVWDQSKSFPDGFLWCTCGSRYRNKSALSLHIKSQSQLISYQCGSCNQEYMSYHSLKTHMKVQHNLICVLSTTPATSESQ